MAQGDYCDYGTYVVRYMDLTNDVDQLVKFVKDVPATGGGDSPEVFNINLNKLLQLQSALFYRSTTSKDIIHMK